MRFILLALTWWNVNRFSQAFIAEATLNTISSAKKMKSVAKWVNFFRSSLRAVQCASVSSCARRPLKHFVSAADAFIWWWQQITYIRMPVFRDISRTVLWVRGWSSWLRTISFTWSLFCIRVGTSLSVAALTPVHCARVFELLEQPVNATCPSFVQKFCHRLSRMIFLQLI